MSVCFKHCRYCAVTGCEMRITDDLIRGHYIEKPQTHYDSIKSMSIERLALFLADMCDGSDKEWWLAWLEQEVDDA